MKKALYEYTDYKAYLLDLMHSQPNEGRGFKSKLAEAMRCQAAYVSQVFNGEAQFSLEQADLVSSFLKHRDDEANYFLLLVQHARAGTESLKARLGRQIDEQRRRMLKLKKDPSKVPLTPEEQVVYYSYWEYAAVHVLISLPGFRTRKAIASYLGIPAPKLQEILNFLVESGLAIRKGEEYSVGSRAIHLDRESPMIARHHATWRLRAIQMIDRAHKDNLHYTSILAISRQDVEKLKVMIREFIQTTKPVIRESPEEIAQCLSIDLFPV